MIIERTTKKGSYAVPGALPCPFCGSTRIQGRDGEDVFPFVICEVCGGSCGYCRTREEALAAWNRRGLVVEGGRG